MPEPYQDPPETDRPNRRRTGSFPVRTSSGDNQQYLPIGTRHVRRRAVEPTRAYADEPIEYASPPPPQVPAFYQQNSSGFQPRARIQQDPGFQYAPYGYPVEPQVIHVQPPDRRRDRAAYDYPRAYDGVARAGVSALYASEQPRPPRPRSRSRSRSYSRSPDRSADSEARTLRYASRGRDVSISEPSSEPILRQRYDSDDYLDDDEIIAAKVYEFSPSRLSHSPSKEPSVGASGSEAESPSLEAKKSPPTQNEVPSTSRTARTLQIYRSEYTGDAFADGSHSARLTVIHDPKKTRQPIFKWMHMKQASLNFDELLHEVSHLSGLTDGDRSGLAKLLAEVKRNCVKSTPAANGSNVKHMDPRFIQILLPPDEAAKGRTPVHRTATWICLPYFSLERYAGPVSAANTTTFPAQTLLQAQYSGVPADRDMKQQVVRQLGIAPPDMCFHINQLWCIMLDNALLITCGTNSAEAALQSDVLEIIREPLKDPSARGASIYVYYTEAVLWALPLDDCASWLAFISHFNDFWPQTLCFSHQDRPVTANDWPRILNLAKHSHSKITLHLKIGNAPQPPPRGILNPLANGGQKAESKTAEEKTQKSLKPPQKGKGNAGLSPAPESEVLPDKAFHVFSWLETVVETSDRNSQIQAESLRTQLQEVEDYLKNSTSFSDKGAYQDSQKATRASCFTYLREQGDSTEKFKKRPLKKRDYEDRIDILNAADIVYQFFLPPEFDGPTVGKFWGAVNLLIQMPQQGSNPERRIRHGTRRTPDPVELVVPTIRSYLRKLTQAIQSFRDILCHAQPLERANITVPDELIRAWLHLLMALIYSAQGAFSWNDHSEIARTLIKKGMEEVIEGMATESLLKRAVVLPLEIVSLVSLKLLEDATGAYPNIGATYSEYLDALGNEIATKPSDRSFQHRLSLLKQEIGVIQKTVAAQNFIYTAIMRSPFKTQLPECNEGPEPRLRERQMVNYGKTSHGTRHSTPERASRIYSSEARPRHDNHHMRSSIDPLLRHGKAKAGYDGGAEDWTFAPEEFYKLSPTDPAGFRDLLTGDCLGFLENRAREFDGFDLHANDLQEENMNKFEDSKDRQELAIYAFTIVTVIFLPLSFVAEVFGMNTSDIRDMELGQWAYWASAIPITVLVILIGLWWMGELTNAFSWLWGGRDGGGGYTPDPKYGRSSGGLLKSRKRAPGPPPPPAYQEPYPQERILDEAVYGARSSDPPRLRQRQGPSYLYY